MLIESNEFTIQKEVVAIRKLHDCDLSIYIECDELEELKKEFKEGHAGCGIINKTVKYSSMS
jgi:hypothetical protein